MLASSGFRKLLVLGFWIAALAAYQVYAYRSGLGPLGAARSLADFLASGLAGALLFVLVYAARPLILFPATLLTVVAGLVFGPVLGVLLSVLGANASATVAFLVGRFFGGEVLESGEEKGFVSRYAGKLRRNSFESVLIMRLVYLPYDLVNYAAGFLGVRWAPFILATAIGSLPATVSFTLLGASLGPDALRGEPTLDWRVLAASAVLLVVSLVLARYFKRRETRRNPQEVSARTPGGR